MTAAQYVGPIEVVERDGRSFVVDSGTGTVIAEVADGVHRFAGDPTAGPCCCGRPYASPIHHDQTPGN